MRPGENAATVLAFFGRTPPTTGNGFARLADAYATSGRPGEALAAARGAWSESDLGSDYEGPFDNSPLMGRANPLAPPVKLQIEADGRVTGTATFGSAYEGPPGHVHGGFVAAAFDELLGLVQIKGGTPGMTGRLTVHYRSPTPLHTELRFDDGGVVFVQNGEEIHCPRE